MKITYSCIAVNQFNPSPQRVFQAFSNSFDSIFPSTIFNKKHNFRHHVSSHTSNLKEEQKQCLTGFTGKKAPLQQKSCSRVDTSELTSKPVQTNFLAINVKSNDQLCGLTILFFFFPSFFQASVAAYLFLSSFFQTLNARLQSVILR